MPASKVHSNAFNFKSFIQHGVDPRTGQYTVSLAIPELKNSFLAGPILPLSIAFNPLNLRDTGFGVGWTINLTEYDPEARVLALGSGETFTLKSGGHEPSIEERKLLNFRFYEDSDSLFRVVHLSGMVEVLRKGGSSDHPKALPERVYGPDGRHIELEYVPFAGERRLSSIRDANDELLSVIRNDMANEVSLLFYPRKGENGEPLARFTIKLDAYDRVVTVVLPTEDAGCWRFKYEEVNDLYCMSEVWTPTGAHEIISYDGEGHSFPGGNITPLPRVGLHRVEPGAEQPPIEVKYEYSPQNFLGNGVLTDWYEDGYDNLYRVSSPSFRYWSKAKLMMGDRSVREVQRSYNRFHLMTDEVTTQGKCRKRAVTRFWTDHPDNVNKVFKDQPAYCQLPMKTETIWELTDDATKRRAATSETHYDDWGNLTERINPDGTREVQTYHPLEGSDTCPPDPEGFVRQLASRTTHPAPSSYGDAPVVRTEHGYVALPVIPWEYGTTLLVEDWHTQAVVDGEEMKRVETTYFDDPDDALRYGRTRQVKETVHALTSTTDYAYAQASPARVAQPTLQVTETLTGFDKTTQSVTEYSALYTGQTALETDLAGVQTLRTYDALNRILSETIAPDTPFAATRTHEYHLIGEQGTGTAWQLTTDPEGVAARSQFDGLTRLVEATRWDPDAEPAGAGAKAGAYRPTYTATFNPLDQLVTETQYDWFGPEDRAYTSQHAFDDWGEAYSTTRPNGVTHVTDKSPFGLRGPVEHRWQIAADGSGATSGHQVLEYNPFGSTDSVVHLDGEEALYTVQQFYDGLGQCVESRAQFGDQERITTFGFDPWRRLEAMTLPGKAQILRTFAAHSAEEMPVEMRVKPGNAAPEILVGTQTFDGLDRLVSRTVGGRQESYTYTQGDMRPASHTTAAGKTVEFTYEDALGDAPLSVTAPDETVTYGYDPISGAVTTTDNGQGTRGYTYTATGELASEQVRTPHAVDRTTRYVHSLRGVLLERQDSSVERTADTLTTTYVYDGAGRLEQTRLGLLSATVEYDHFSRPWLTTQRNLATGQTVNGERTYDAMGRETKRALKVGSQTFTVDQVWRGDDQLNQRTLSTGGATLLEEDFYYDVRGRLLRHVCSGSQLPQDRHGNRIVHQIFTYDDLGNMRRCTTEFEDESRDIAEHTYATTDPCQLITITHTHDSYAPLETFEYDDDGNLLNDHQGTTLRYDSLGRLLSMAQANHETRYFYDGHGELLGSAHDGGSMVLRQHVGYQYHHQVADDTTYALYANGELVGIGSTQGPGSAQLALTHAIGTVIGQVREADVTTTAYSAYGEAGTALAELLGFNGETREHGDWYLLGRGYRAYNPALRRFNRPDSLSPFDGGGVNPYAYCEGNPIRFHDPTGHLVREMPEYFYPSPPPEPQPQPQQKGGGWLAWLGVGISAVFLVASVVTAPWSLGITAPLMVKSMIGIGIQAAGIALGVASMYVEDPTLQVVTMIGSMALGMYGGMMSGKAAAKASTLIKQQKAASLTPAKTSLSEVGDAGLNVTRPTAPTLDDMGATAFTAGGSAPQRTSGSRLAFNRPEATHVKIPRVPQGPVHGMFRLNRDVTMFPTQGFQRYHVKTPNLRGSPTLGGYTQSSGWMQYI